MNYFPLAFMVRCRDITLGKDNRLSQPCRQHFQQCICLGKAASIHQYPRSVYDILLQLVLRPLAPASDL
jgi:hypothetical protein